jgi:hypothetical protein
MFYELNIYIQAGDWVRCVLLNEALDMGDAGRWTRWVR